RRIRSPDDESFLSQIPRLRRLVRYHSRGRKDGRSIVSGSGACARTCSIAALASIHFWSFKPAPSEIVSPTDSRIGTTSTAPERIKGDSVGVVSQARTSVSARSSGRWVRGVKLTVIFQRP